MAAESATVCNARGILCFTHVVLNSLCYYFTEKYKDNVADEDLDRYVFARAYTYYYGGDFRRCPDTGVDNWNESKQLPFFVTRVYDILVEKGELPQIDVRSTADSEISPAVPLS
jgi:hypothetical protein